MPSGLATDSNDHLTRRDEGLEFLDVTSQTNIQRVSSNSHGSFETDNYTITNTGTSVVDTHLLIVVQGLASGVTLENASGTTSTGNPYIRVFLTNGVIEPGQNIAQAFDLQAAPGATTVLRR